MYVVGLTGGIGSGKSTVCRMFQQLGCIVIDADFVAREVVEPGKPAWHDLRKRFGPGVFHSDGSLNRDVLGLIIFGDELKRKLFNSITHPRICRAILRRLFRHMINGEQFVILDLPQLYETGMMTSFVYSTIVVSCTAAEQVERIRARNGYTEEAAADRVNAQIPLNVKRQRADYVIDNSGDGRTLIAQVSKLHLKLRSSYAQWKFRFTVFCFVAYPLLLVVMFRIIFVLDKK